MDYNIPAPARDAQVNQHDVIDPIFEQVHNPNNRTTISLE